MSDLTARQLLRDALAASADKAAKLVEQAEREFIRLNIQPHVEREHIKAGSDEVIEDFEITIDKQIVWTLVTREDCPGCDGEGTISSNIGTLTDCPDCDGSGDVRGPNTSEREVTTDYDGKAL